jgi:hypothetical protein
LERLRNLNSEFPHQAMTLTDNQRQSLIENTKILKPYQIPIKNRIDGTASYSKVDGIAIDWTIRMFGSAASKCFTSPTDPHQKQIQINTQEFETWARGLAD